MPMLWISPPVGEPPMSTPALQPPPVHESSWTRPVFTVPTYRRLTPSLRPGPTSIELFCVPVEPIASTDHTRPVRTFSEIGVECDTASAVPTTSSWYMPWAAPAEAVTVTRLVSAVVSGCGLYVAVTPVARPGRATTPRP